MHQETEISEEFWELKVKERRILNTTDESIPGRFTTEIPHPHIGHLPPPTGHVNICFVRVNGV